MLINLHYRLVNDATRRTSSFIREGNLWKWENTMANFVWSVNIWKKGSSTWNFVRVDIWPELPKFSSPPPVKYTNFFFASSSGRPTFSVEFIVSQRCLLDCLTRFIAFRCNRSSQLVLSSAFPCRLYSNQFRKAEKLISLESPETISIRTRLLINLRNCCLWAGTKRGIESLKVRKAQSDQWSAGKFSTKSEGHASRVTMCSLICPMRRAGRFHASRIIDN